MFTCAPLVFWGTVHCGWDMLATSDPSGFVTRRTASWFAHCDFIEIVVVVVVVVM